MRHLRGILAAHVCWLAVVAPVSAQPAVVGLDNGSFRLGAGTVVFGDDGRMSVYVGADCLVQNATIACGLNG